VFKKREEREESEKEANWVHCSRAERLVIARERFTSLIDGGSGQEGGGKRSKKGLSRLTLTGEAADPSTKRVDGIPLHFQLVRERGGKVMEKW